MFKTKGLTILATALFAVASFGLDAHAGNWWETIKVKGDFRYRHEMIKKGDDDASTRQRIRARLGITGKVNDFTSVGIQLATGSDDPVSTNQTLGSSFSTKQVGIDLAYFETSHSALPGLTLTAGKFKNPFFKPGKSELIWDSDFNPEGGVLTYHSKGQTVDLTAIGSGLMIEERSSDPNSFLMAGQGLARVHFEDGKSSVAFGLGFFSYTNVETYQPFHNTEKSMGNSVVDQIVGIDTAGGEIDTLTQDVYGSDYDLLEFYGEINHGFENIPVTLLADYVQNTSADSLETGWLFGVRVGAAKKPGSWAFRYNYRKVEKDAVLGAFSDSDFAGGGSNAKGHELGGNLVLASNMTFGLSYFINETKLTSETTNDYKRMQVDLQLKF